MRPRGQDLARERDARRKPTRVICDDEQRRYRAKSFPPKGLRRCPSPALSQLLSDVPHCLRRCFAPATGWRSQRGPREFHHGLLAKGPETCFEQMRQIIERNDSWIARAQIHFPKRCIPLRSRQLHHPSRTEIERHSRTQSNRRRRRDHCHVSIGRQPEQGLPHPRPEPRKRLALKRKSRLDPRPHYRHIAMPPGPMRRGLRIGHLPLELFVLQPESLVLARQQRPDSRIDLIQIELTPAIVDHRRRTRNPTRFHRGHHLVCGHTLPIESARDYRIEPDPAFAEPRAKSPRLLMADPGKIVINQARTGLPVSNQRNQPERLANDHLASSPPFAQNSKGGERRRSLPPVLHALSGVR